jgi:hypothetical protein
VSIALVTLGTGFGPKNVYPGAVGEIARGPARLIAERARLEEEAAARPGEQRDEHHCEANPSGTEQPHLRSACRAAPILARARRHFNVVDGVTCRLSVGHSIVHGGMSVRTAMRPNGPPDKERRVTRYLISFDAHAMDDIPEADMPAVARAAHAMVEEAMSAGVWVFGGGLETQKASVVAADGTITDGSYPEAIGGFWVIDVPSREEALRWAAKTADACRCAQEVREFMPDPAVGN